LPDLQFPIADCWPAERIRCVGHMVVHQFANVIAMIESTQEAIDRVDRGVTQTSGRHVGAGLTFVTRSNA
jgi:hypothetical protein